MCSSEVYGKEESCIVQAYKRDQFCRAQICMWKSKVLFTAVLYLRKAFLPRLPLTDASFLKALRAVARQLLEVKATALDRVVTGQRVLRN